MVALFETVYSYTPGRWPVTTRVLVYPAFSWFAWVSAVTTVEMLYELLVVMTAPFLVQMRVVGGPPLVTPRRVKDGLGRGVEDDDITATTLVVIAPRSEISLHSHEVFLLLLV